MKGGIQKHGYVKSSNFENKFDAEAVRKYLETHGVKTIPVQKRIYKDGCFVWFFLFESNSKCKDGKKQHDYSKGNTCSICGKKKWGVR